MDRYFKVFIFTVTVITAIAFNSSSLHANNLKNEKQIATKEQAAKHAAKLANEKCQKDFGYSPFKPESYKAEFVDSKWHWGKIVPMGIHGYSAEVEFCKDGTDEKVRIVFHTDIIDSKYRTQDNEKVKIKKEDIERKVP